MSKKQASVTMAMDKRIIKTRNSIKTAFMQLTLEGMAGKISVSDLASRAQINRSTFYLHYCDVAAVKGDIQRDIADRISDGLESFVLSDIYGSTYSILTALTELLDENEILKNYIIFSSDSENITGWLKETFVENTTETFAQSFPLIDRESIIYSLTFIGAGIVDSYIKWARNKESRKPLEELIRELSDITNYIIADITSK